MAGWDSQDAGDWGESIVKSALSEGRITSASLDPDLGEDFLIEIHGREASTTGAHPKAALVQVKACINECHDDVIKVPGIKKVKLMRWSAQQLPVFIVAVSGFKTLKPAFYVKSVDEFLEECYPGFEVRDISTASVTIMARLTDNLAAALSLAVGRFHRLVDADLSALSLTDKRNEHFEVVRRGKPDVLGRLVKPVSWHVIWRASRRPAYFAAMITDLFREAHEEYRALNVPAYMSFHIYRSQHDLNHNMALARVHWIDDMHPRFRAAVEVWGQDNPTIKYIETEPEIREHFESRTAETSEFVTHVKLIAPRVDKFARKLLRAEDSKVCGRGFWTTQVIVEMEELDRIWQSTPYAPTEFKVLDDILGNYIQALINHRLFSGKAHWNPNAEEERYRLETAVEIQYYYGAWWVLLKNSGWDFDH